MSQENKAVRASVFSIVSNTVLAIVKGVAGILGNSYALIADAIESTTDIFASLLVWMGLRYARRPADSNHPYGHGKIEPLITFIVVGFLIVSATVIAFQGIKNIQDPQGPPEKWTLVVLAVIIIWKEISYRFIRKRSEETESSSLKADAWHHRSDAITSIAAFIGIAIAVFMGDGYESADDWAAIFAAGFILYNSYLIFRPALAEIMDEDVYDDLIEEIRQIASEVEGISGTEKCFIRKAGMKYHVDLHAMVDGSISVTKGHELAHDLQNVLYRKLPQLGNVLIHIEPDDME